MTAPPFRVERKLRTNEDWYPTTNGCVRASLIELRDGMWRVCVWGGDDFGLEKDFPPDQRAQAEMLYTLLADYMTQAEMRAEGMYPA